MRRIPADGSARRTHHRRSRPARAAPPSAPATCAAAKPRRVPYNHPSGRSASWRSRCTLLSSTGCGTACSSRSSPRPLPCAEARARASVRLDRQAAGHGEALDGGRRQSACGGGRLPDPARRAARPPTRRSRCNSCSGSPSRSRRASAAARSCCCTTRRRSASIAYDGRETAPAAAKPDRFLKNGKPLDFFDAVVGGRSVGVPGTVRLLEDRASQARPPQVGGALRAGDRAGREAASRCRRGCIRCSRPRDT